jgi:hypothetical protein
MIENLNNRSSKNKISIGIESTRSSKHRLDIFNKEALIWCNISL